MAMNEKPQAGPTQAPGNGTSKNSPKSYILAGLVVLGLLALLIFWFLKSQPTSLFSSQISSDPAIGPSSAKVTIIEYGDFGCTTCLAWEKSGVRQKVIDTYGNKVRFVWKDFPVITAESPKAAEAGQCAFDQDKFWAYHDLLYAKAPALSVNDLKAYAVQAGLDSSRFDQCLDSGKDKAKVDQSWQEAYQLGFQATPDFLINGQKVVGPLSFDQARTLINQFLGSGG